MPLGTCDKLNEEGTETPPPSASDLPRRVPEESNGIGESTPSHGSLKFLLSTSLVPKGRCLAFRPVVITALFFTQKIDPYQLLEPHNFQMYCVQGERVKFPMVASTRAFWILPCFPPD